MSSIFKLGILSVIFFGASLFLTPQAAVSQDDESSRQITLDRFNKARPAESNPSGNRTALRAAVYRRIGASRSNRRSPRSSFEDIGVTIWRLRPSRSSDEGARVLVMDGLRQNEWTPERIEADTPLKIGDRVRISVESPRPGYLYMTAPSVNRC